MPAKRHTDAQPPIRGAITIADLQACLDEYRDWHLHITRAPGAGRTYCVSATSSDPSSGGHIEASAADLADALRALGQELAAD